MKQLRFWNNEIKVKSKQTDKVRKNWENAFQRWSNTLSQDGTTSLGACGYSSICEYCKDNSYGRPCVRALNLMCKERKIIIDYTKRNFEDIWRM